jgi:thiaminase
MRVIKQIHICVPLLLYSEMYIARLIHENQSLWDEVVQHELITDMFEDTLPIDQFRDYMVQLRVIIGEGLRNILCRLLADCRPDQSIAASIVGHIQSVQPGGDHYDAIAEMLKATSPPGGSHLQHQSGILPASQAIVDYVFLIGLNGSVHEKVLAVATLVEITNARFQLARDQKKLPMNPIYSSWFAHHAASILRPRVEWLHSALDATVASGSIDHESDTRMFRRLVQWVILMNDSVCNRGRFEWPIDSKYYHKREIPPSE